MDQKPLKQVNCLLQELEDEGLARIEGHGCGTWYYSLE